MGPKLLVSRLVCVFSVLREDVELGGKGESLGKRGRVQCVLESFGCAVSLRGARVCVAFLLTWAFFFF